MKKQYLLVPLALFLTSCSNGYNDGDQGLIDQENINIISDINELAIDTFINKNKSSLASNVDDEIDYEKKNFTPRAKSDVKEEIIKNVEKHAATDPRAQWVYNNYFNLSDVEAYLTGNDPDTIEFIYNMNHNITDFKSSDGESIKLNRKTPYYIQWDNRWAYKELGQKNIGISGCGPTSVAMVLSRLKNDSSITPEKVAADAKEYMSSEGIEWTFFADEAKRYDYSIKDINLDEKEMIGALENGPIIVSVSKGYFTLFGHIFVIDSYEDGKFLVNDPNSVKNTMRPWSYDEINDQIVRMWQIY